MLHAACFLAAQKTVRVISSLIVQNDEACLRLIGEVKSCAMGCADVTRTFLDRPAACLLLGRVARHLDSDGRNAAVQGNQQNIGH